MASGSHSDIIALLWSVDFAGQIRCSVLWLPYNGDTFIYPLSGGHAALSNHLNRNPVRRDWLMKTAYIEATFLSELRFMVSRITKSVIGDTILVLLMLATLIL